MHVDSNIDKGIEEFHGSDNVNQDDTIADGWVPYY